MTPKILTRSEIPESDTFVSMVPVVQTKVTFNEAIDLILEALKPLGVEYLRTLDNGLRSRWVDRYETKGKRSGGFASSSYGNPPYILMKLQGGRLLGRFYSSP
jgi:oligoendopeptidase F